LKLVKIVLLTTNRKGLIMLSLEEYLAGQGILRDADGDLKATSKQVLEYLKDREFCSVDLSPVTMSENLSINGLEFEDFHAQNCDFNGGLEIRNCKFTESLYLMTSYVQSLFRLENVEISGDLDMPQNLTELSKEQIEILNIAVKGKTTIDQP